MCRLAASLIVLGLLPLLTAGYLESDYPQARVEPGPPSRPGPILPPPPPPREDNVVTRYLDRATVHPPAHYRGLCLFPVSIRDEQPLRNLLSLAEALKSGALRIEELDRATVERARFVNTSKRFVFAMAGEVILGGKQNRAVRDDVLIGPDSSVVVPLYCIQQGRWHGGAKFGSAPGLGPPGIRSMVQSGRSQNDVWGEVERSNRAGGVASDSGDLGALLSDRKTRQTLAACRKAVLPRLPRGCTGLVVSRGRRIVGADLFVDRAIFTRLRDRVIDSYALHCLVLHRPDPARADRAPRWLPPPADRHAAKAYLDRCYRATYTIEPTPGLGRLHALSGAAEGRALSYDDNLLHLNLYEPLRVLPEPVPMPPPRPRPPGPRPPWPRGHE